MSWAPTRKIIHLRRNKIKRDRNYLIKRNRKELKYNKQNINLINILLNVNLQKKRFGQFKYFVKIYFVSCSYMALVCIIVCNQRVQN